MHVLGIWKVAIWMRIAPIGSKRALGPTKNYTQLWICLFIAIWKSWQVPINEKEFRVIQIKNSFDWNISFNLSERLFENVQLLCSIMFILQRVAFKKLIGEFTFVNGLQNRNVQHIEII